MHIFLGFRKGKLVTVVYSILNEIKDSVDMEYYISDPQDVEQQILEWRKRKL